MEKKMGGVHGLAHLRAQEWIGLFEVKGSHRKMRLEKWG